MNKDIFPVNISLYVIIDMTLFLVSMILTFYIKIAMKLYIPKVKVAWPISMIFSPALLYLTSRELQYPSATKKSPQAVTATDVGLQKRTALFPGTNRSPKVSRGVRSFFCKGGNLNTWCSATSVNHKFSSGSIVIPWGR